MTGRASSNSVQRQDSLTDQVQRVWKLALDSGEQDAADWIRRTFNPDAIPDSAAELKAIADEAKASGETA